MQSGRGKHGVMALKIDLEKTYDHVSWAFLYDTLNEAGVPATLVDVIMTCVSTSTVQILWNGDMTDSFTPSRGLRQGCPFSPYLFVLCMERLAHEITQAVEAEDWKPFQMCKNGPPLTHLFFADDLLLFGQADMVTAETITNVLEDFCNCLGVKVSIAKTTLFFSKKVTSAAKRSLKDLLGIREVDNLGHYLGVPILHKRVNKVTYAYILEKMKGKIANWSATPMSLAGRITLAQAVLSTMPLYAMQTSKLPMGMCNDMENVIRGFVWGKKEDHNRMSKVAWDKVIRPKEEGGLGATKVTLSE